MAVRAFRPAIFLLVVGVLANRAFAAEGCKLGQIAELAVTMNGMGPTISAKINGTEARFIVDSGAFFSLISGPAAAQYKLETEPAPFNLMLEGVGGAERAMVTTVKEFTIAGVAVKKVQFVVGGSAFGGGAVGLIGQNVLHIADVEYDLANGAIRLIKADNCGKRMLAYWAREGDVYSQMDINWSSASSPHTTGVAMLNGKKIHVMFDTGSAFSMLNLRAAARAGITPDSPGVVKAGLSRGIGSHSVQTYLATFQSFKIGDEEVRNPKLRFGDIHGMEEDMLIGADFFLSHRIYVATGQRKLYATYNGGPVFNLTERSVPVASGEPPAASGPDGSAQPEIPADQPTDAAGFSRRGAAFAARRDFQHALEDLTRACELAPTEPDYFFERAKAYAGNRESERALADYDQVIRLKPDHLPALVSRAGLTLAKLEATGRGDPGQVLADLSKASAVAAKEDDVHLEIGMLYSRMGNFGLAIPQYDVWLDKHPPEGRTPDAYGQRCRARAMLGLELDKALSDCNRAVRGREDVPLFLDSRGMVYLRMGSFDKAIADYDAVLRMQPKNPWALYGRGLAKVRKGDKAGGEADIAAAKASNPRIVTQAVRHGLTE
jgi:tetratricopeptide (TPR) repeat protein/predicted aspartyl protease